MHTDVDCLGRISVNPRLLTADRDAVCDLTTCWGATRLGLVLRHSSDRATVVAELRRLIGAHFEPAGYLLHGLVVARTEEGDVFTVAARRNRVTSRQLWTAEQEPWPDRGRVIELDRRRRSAGGSRDLPAG
jgi:hypothetical protein